LRQTEDTGDQDEIKGESSALECNRKELHVKEDCDDIGDELSEYQALIPDAKPSDVVSVDGSRRC